MSNSAPWATGPENSTKPPKRAMSFIRFAMWLCVMAVAAMLLRELIVTRSAQNESKLAEERSSRSTGLVDLLAKHLASEFTDSKGRLLADPPAASDLLDPQVIVVAHTVSTDVDSPTANYALFEKLLAEKTGRKVVDQKFTNSAADLTQVKEGKITVLALHAADAPFLVNNYGYQPVAALGDDSGANGNHLDILVKPHSLLTKLSDLQGHALICTVPSSITGYRAAIALLMKNEGLKPLIDYQVLWSMKQKDSINGVIKGTYEAAAVSDDKIQSMLKSGKISASEYNIMYQSEVIPRTTIGWLYNLKPELAEKIRAAILEYRPASTTQPSDADAETADDTSAKPLHFIAIDYKKDFQLVRDIDDRFDPRLDSRTVEKKAERSEP